MAFPGIAPSSDAAAPPVDVLPEVWGTVVAVPAVAPGLVEAPDVTATDPAVSTPMDQSLILRLRVSLAGVLTRGDQFAATFYRNLFDLWATDQYFPLAYTRSRVEAVAAERLQLSPE